MEMSDVHPPDPEAMVAPASDKPGHPSAAEVAAYLDRTLPQVEHTQIEAHLDDCRECREEVVALSRVLRKLGPKPILRWVAVGGIAATLALVVGRMALGPGNVTAPNTTQPIERSAPGEGHAGLVAIRPTGNAPVRRDAVLLQWASAPNPGVHYRLTLSQADGRVLWTASTRDTMLQVPSSVRLAGGRTYYWYTDVLLPDGRTLTTGVQEFRLIP